MSIWLQIEEMPGYLVVRFTGSGALEEVWRQFEMISERCKRANKNKLLIDFTGTYTGAPLADRYFLGERAQIFACYKLKVAGVLGPERFDPQGFGELVAQNRGVTVRAFTNVEDAKKWLLE